MFYLKCLKFNRCTLSRTFKEMRLCLYLSTNTCKCNTEEVLIKENNDIQTRLIYNSVLEQKKIKYGFKRNIIQNKLNNKDTYLKTVIASQQPIPLILRNVEKVNSSKDNEKDNNCDIIDTSVSKSNSCNQDNNMMTKDIQNWMTAYDNYADVEEVDFQSSGINYGTPDPHCRISKVPCGGCGALLHCKDKSIPGYIPSEIYKNSNLHGGSNLAAVKCQRCHFLENYNISLKVAVNAEDYIQVIKEISKVKHKLIVLIVDLLDFPGSIWQGISDIFNNNTPLVLVGNKVDLLPKDNKNYLARIKDVFLTSAKEYGFSNFDIKHVALISAKTGYGVEELINNLQNIWKHQGDVYLLGCTNVGKSTLFNTLVHSDYCKYQASDLIPKATISLLPGTTLNLLKFPIFRPNSVRNELRNQRLEKTSKILTEQRKLNKELLSTTNNPKYAILSSPVEQTFTKTNYVDKMKDGFQVSSNSNASGINKLGINEKDPIFAESRWCFDTPGVIQSNQIIHLLTTDELDLTLSKNLIQPQSFCLKPGTSLFIAGLCKLDYVKGPNSIRLTVFRSKDLPITICNQEESETLYNSLLKTDLFKVPQNDSERLTNWPGLEITNSFSLVGIGAENSCKDIVFSNTGWIAVQGRQNCEYHFTSWSPQHTGVYLRDCILPKAVNLRGARIRNSVCYKFGKLYMK